MATPTLMDALGPMAESRWMHPCAMATASSSSSLRARENSSSPPIKPGVYSALRLAFPHLPSIAEAVARRTVAYNAARRKLFELEEQGRALIVTPEDLAIDKMEMNVERLEDAFDAGVALARRDLPRWEAFLGL